MASGNASLAGAEFTFRYYDGQYATVAEAEASGAPTRTWIFRTDEDGEIHYNRAWLISGELFYYGAVPTVPIGTLLIQETKAPEGYLIDSTVYVRNITPDGTLEAVNSYNAPVVQEQVIMGRIQIVKHTDTGVTKVETPEVGATFNIYLASAGSYDAAPANARAQLTVDADGFAVTGELPYGTYTVHQTSGWAGSKLMEDFQVKIDENGKTYSYIINNQRFYSYLTVEKTDTRTGEVIPAEGIGFKLYDPEGQQISWRGKDVWYSDAHGIVEFPMLLEYGEGYSVIEQNAPEGYILNPNPVYFDVKEENSTIENELVIIRLQVENAPTQISLAKVDYAGSYVPGAKLELLDAAGKVVEQWTTEAAPHTVYGLPIGGEYTLHEAAAPEGWLTAEDVTFTVQNTAEVQSITMEDEEIPLLETAATVDGSNVAYATEQVTLTDTVRYAKLVPGREYTVTGALMVKSTGKPLTDAEGQPITSSVAFTPETADGSIEVVFNFDASKLGGEDVVVFEEISRNGRLYAAHTDLEDGEQTVHFVEIDSAAAVDGSNVAYATEQVTLTDTLLYRNLMPGREYTATGALMLKSTGKPLTDADGQPITSSVTFTPETADGSIEVVFNFDASKLGGEDVVVFEELHENGRLIARHTDLEDAGQTVHFVEIDSVAAVDGSNVALATEQVTLIDTLLYRNLVPGREYTATGALMLKSTSAPLTDAEGQPITSSVTFTPETADGSIEVVFNFDASLLGGEDVVVFEDLHESGRLIARHADLEDAGQTVHFDWPIGRIDLRDAKPTGKSWSSGGKTGDSGIILYLTLGVASLMGGVVIVHRRKGVRK